MQETCIECPSCNRRIRIGLYATTAKLYQDYEKSHYEDVPRCPQPKEYDIRDVLWVNEELARENEELRRIIKHLEIVNDR